MEIKRENSINKIKGQNKRIIPARCITRCSFSKLKKKDVFYKTIRKRQQSNGRLQAKNIIGHSQKTQLANKIYKMFHLTNNFKCRWKQDIISHLTDLQRLRRFIPHNVVEDVVTRPSHTMLMEGKLVHSREQLGIIY